MLRESRDEVERKLSRESRGENKDNRIKEKYEKIENEIDMIKL